MGKQLELSQHELEAIGFTRNCWPADENENERVYYTVPVINGQFIYNYIGEFKHSDNNAPYKWYLKTTTGDAANYIWLLKNFISFFRVKYNLVMF